MRSHGKRKDACTGKTKYTTEARATRSARRLGMKEQTPFDVYQCRFCGLWHTGHAVPFGVRESVRRCSEAISSSDE